MTHFYSVSWIQNIWHYKHKTHHVHIVNKSVITLIDTLYVKNLITDYL